MAWQGKVYMKEEVVTICGLGEVTGLQGHIEMYKASGLKDELAAEETHRNALYQEYRAFSRHFGLQEQINRVNYSKPDDLVKNMGVESAGMPPDSPISSGKVMTQGEQPDVHSDQGGANSFFDYEKNVEKPPLAASVSLVESVLHGAKEEKLERLHTVIGAPIPNGHTVAEQIFRSFGAKAKNYNVYNPSSDEFTTLVEGTRITQPKNHVIARMGRERQIDVLDWLMEKYDDYDAANWTKEKGFGYVYDEFGDPRRLELHWYNSPKRGRVEMKLKRQKDGNYYLD